MTRIMMMLQSLLLVALVLTMAGHKWHWWGFGVLATGMAAELVAILLLGLFALGLLLWIGYRRVRRLARQSPLLQGAGSGRRRRRRRSVLPTNPARVPQLAIIVGLAVIPLVVGLSLVGSGLDKPLIHDVTTDFEDVPQFRAALVARSIKENSLEYEGDKVARLQVSHYPDVVPLLTTRDSAATFAAVEALVQQRGWQVLRSDAEAGELEAVVETELMGFLDDVIIRVRPGENAPAAEMLPENGVALESEAAAAADSPKSPEAVEAGGAVPAESEAVVAGGEAENSVDLAAAEPQAAEPENMAGSAGEEAPVVGSRVDMRSVSRVGNGDLGANAARIEAFLADLAHLLEPQLVSQ